MKSASRRVSIFRKLFVKNKKTVDKNKGTIVLYRSCLENQAEHECAGVVQW